MVPFLKWPGGKRQLLSELEKFIPDDYKNYFEPFIGGGALFFYLHPGETHKAFISDKNEILINTYQQVRDTCSELISFINELDDSINSDKSAYYSSRDKFNKKITNNEKDTELAALFIFLNKHCFNGIYRVNKKGEFNTPWNHSFCKSIDETNMIEINNYLKDNHIHIQCGDFQDCLSAAEEKDLVFLDSPYDSFEKQCFDLYTTDRFSDKDHIRLADEFKRLDKKGCYLITTNHNTPLIKELYDGFNFSVVAVNRSINCKGNNRKDEEVIITNFKPSS